MGKHQRPTRHGPGRAPDTAGADARQPGPGGGGSPGDASLGELFVYAASCADRDGLCFVHPTDAEPVYALLSAARYRDLTGRLFGGEIPVDDPEWQHDHATPEMLEHLREQEG